VKDRVRIEDGDDLCTASILGEYKANVNHFPSGTASGKTGTVQQRQYSVHDPVTNHIDYFVSSGQTYYYITTAVSSSGEESGYPNESKAVISQSLSCNASHILHTPIVFWHVFR
jgi:hypothetical protein